MRRSFQQATLFGSGLGQRDLIAIACSLGTQTVRGWSRLESALVRDLPRVDQALVDRFRAAIQNGKDPLGEELSEARPQIVRRELGATYTPSEIVAAMLRMITESESHMTPDRIVDPGCGSARFLMRAGMQFPKAQLLGIETDPVAAIIARANLAAMGFTSRSEIRLADFRETTLEPIKGRTLFLGNPPYIRHHRIGTKWKTWLSATASRLRLPASQLCGLHLYFYLATAIMGRPGDQGAYITASEWLDVNYGELLRKLATRQLGLQRLTLIEPTAKPFPDAATTASIAIFALGHRVTSVNFCRVRSTDALKSPGPSKSVPVERLEAEPRWTIFTRSCSMVPKGYIELGDLCRVHRGQVTGANDVWVVRTDSRHKLPQSVLFATVTRARELFNAGRRLSDASQLRRVVDLPVDLDDLAHDDRDLVENFLVFARAKGADRGYVAENRKRWWAVGLRAPALILCTYMARRPPAFVENTAEARHINIAHGLYPRISLAPRVTKKLIEFLSTQVSTNLGRTYAGGLTKFEPGEIERIPVPDISILQQDAS